MARTYLVDLAGRGGCLPGWGKGCPSRQRHPMAWPAVAPHWGASVIVMARPALVRRTPCAKCNAAMPPNSRGGPTNAEYSQYHSTQMPMVQSVAVLAISATQGSRVVKSCGQACVGAAIWRAGGSSTSPRPPRQHCRPRVSSNKGTPDTACTNFGPRAI